MILKAFIVTVVLFAACGLIRIMSYNPHTVDAVLVVETIVDSNDVGEFLKAISSVGEQLGLTMAKTISENSNGMDVVALQFTRDDEVVFLVVNSLVDAKFFISFYGDKAEAIMILEYFRDETSNRWILIVENEPK